MKAVGILLAVYSSRGHQLVFQYPPREDFDQEQAELFPALEPNFLADILSPKAPLCDKKFQLCLNDITFIGIPTMLAANRPVTGTAVYTRAIRKWQQQCHKTRCSAKSGMTFQGPMSPDGSNSRLLSPSTASSSITTPQHTKSPIVDDMQLGPDEVKLLYYADLISPESFEINGNQYQLNNSISSADSFNSSFVSLGSNMHLPAVSTTNQPVDESSSSDINSDSKRKENISSENFLKLLVANEGSTSNAGLVSSTSDVNNNRARGNNGLTMFHVAFAIARDGENDDIDAFANQLYEDILVRLTAALKYEQMKRNYLRLQCTLISTLQEEHGAETSISNICTAHEQYPLSFSSIKTPGSVQRQQPSNSVLACVLAKSSLARLLFNVYNSVITKTPCHLVVNNFVYADFLLRAPGMNLRSLWNFPIPPFKALLLLIDPEKLLHQLPKGSNPLLQSVIKVATPTRCLKEICSLLEIPFSTLSDLVHHLIAWQYATIIHRVHSRDLYISNCDLDYSELRNLQSQFFKLFPSMSLSNVLSSWRKPAAISSVIPSVEDRQHRVKIAAWLLRHQLICQLHLHIHIRQINPDNSANKVGIIAHPESTSGPEYDMICQIATTASDFAVRALFLRLAPFMNGKSSIETMEHSTKIARKDIKRMITAFDSYLVTMLSPAKNLFYR